MVTNKAYSIKIGVFNSRAAADKAIADLRAAGYRDDQIGLVAKDENGGTTKTDGAGHSQAGTGAAIGAATGASVGGLVGLGVMTGMIPVVGPVMAIGAIGTVLLNAAGGAAIAGVAGALVGWGIPEEDARYYENEVKQGRYLVTVEAGDRTDSSAIFSKHGGYDRYNASATTRTVQSPYAGERTFQAKEE